MFSVLTSTNWRRHAGHRRAHINVRQWRDVIWAFSTRADPAREWGRVATMDRATREWLEDIATDLGF
jgi:3-polyprenyl-4-hydroxybenzoate decarboxylase